MYITRQIIKWAHSRRIHDLVDALGWFPDIGRGNTREYTERQARLVLAADALVDVGVCVKRAAEMVKKYEDVEVENMTILRLSSRAARKSGTTVVFEVDMKIINNIPLGGER